MKDIRKEYLIRRAEARAIKQAWQNAGCPIGFIPGSFTVNRAAGTAQAGSERSERTSPPSTNNRRN